MKLLRELIRRFEGCANILGDGMVYAYLCPAGKPTQGWGELVESLSVPPITQQTADDRLEKLMPAYLLMALRECPQLALAPPEVQEVVADFVYNLGAGAFRASTFRRRLAEGRYDEAARECRRWVNAGGRRMRGLVLRREAEALVLEAAAK